MNRSVIAFLLGASSFTAMAQMTPVGLWKTVDDNSGAIRSEIRISDRGGVLNGVIEKALIADAQPNCVKCTDERQGKPKIGLEIIHGAKKLADKDVWEGGNIVDPDSGTIYKLKLTPIEGGKKLEVRAFIGFSLLGRTQTWLRAQ